MVSLFTTVSLLVVEMLFILMGVFFLSLGGKAGYKTAKLFFYSTAIPAVLMVASTVTHFMGVW